MGDNTLQFFRDNKEYRTYLYRRDLRSNAVKLGVLLLIFFGAQQGLAYTAGLIIKATGTAVYYDRSSAMQLLINGVISSLIFFVIGVIYCLIRRLSFARLFPFDRIGGAMLVMLCFVGLTFTLMSNYASSMVTEVFSLFGLRNSGGEILRESTRTPVALYYLTVAVLPAFAEEFAFRGVVMGSLRKYSDALALLVSSAAFALMHGNFVQLPFTFCCGMVFGFLVIKTNSLLPAIIIHFLNNALSVTHDVLIAYGVVSSTVYNVIFAAVILALVIPSIFFLRRIIREKPTKLRFDDSDRAIPFRSKMKATVSAPTMISFAVIMMLYAGYALVRQYF